MSVITAIKSQKKSGRVNVYLDGKFGFGIDLDNFVKLGLKVEQELSEKEVEEIVKKAEFQKTLDKLLRFAMLRPRSEKEIKNWFRRKKIYESLWQNLFAKLKHFELVDDVKFATWWVEQRSNFRPKPKRILEQELRTKGITKEVVDEILGNLSQDEEKMAKDLLTKNANKWEGLEGRDKYQKIAQYLLRKGFDRDVVKKLLSIDQED